MFMGMIIATYVHGLDDVHVRDTSVCCNHSVCSWTWRSLGMFMDMIIATYVHGSDDRYVCSLG